MEALGIGDRPRHSSDKGEAWKTERDELRTLKKAVGELLKQQRELLRRLLG
jgi:hypothetical protein